MDSIFILTDDLSLVYYSLKKNKPIRKYKNFMKDIHFDNKNNCFKNDTLLFKGEIFHIRRGPCKLKAIVRSYCEKKLLIALKSKMCLISDSERSDNEHRLVHMDIRSGKIIKVDMRDKSYEDLYEKTSTIPKKIFSLENEAITFNYNELLKLRYSDKEPSSFNILGQGKSLQSISITYDNKHLFVLSPENHLMQFDYCTNSLEACYVFDNETTGDFRFTEDFNDSMISQMIVTRDNKFLFMSKINGLMAKIDIQSRKVVKLFGRKYNLDVVQQTDFTFLKITSDSKKLFCLNPSFLRIYSIEDLT